ncbi:MAG: hypothetical protein AAF467_04325 [Actinomycetota bacterium]
MKIRYPKALIGTAAVIAIAGAATALPGAAQGTTADEVPASSDTATVSEIVADDTAEADFGEFSGDECVIHLDDESWIGDGFEGEELTDAEFAELFGDIEELTDAELEELLASEAVAIDGDWEPTAEELADINAETDELIAHLAANGYTFDVETDEYGVRYPVIDDDTFDAELERLIDEFYTERYGDWGTMEIAEGDGDNTVVIEEWEPTAEELAEANAETDELIAHLAANGYTFDVETDEYGYRHPIIDANTYDAELDTLINDFFVERYGDWEDMEIAEDAECVMIDDLDGEIIEAVPGDGFDDLDGDAVEAE